MTSHSFPDPVFESLLEKLARTLEVAQRADSTLDPQTRQALYQTVNITPTLEFPRCPVKT